MIDSQNFGDSVKQWVTWVMSIDGTIVPSDPACARDPCRLEIETLIVTTQDEALAAADEIRIGRRSGGMVHHRKLAMSFCLSVFDVSLGATQQTIHGIVHGDASVCSSLTRLSDLSFCR